MTDRNSRTSTAIEDGGSGPRDQSHRDEFMRLLVRHERHVHGFILSLHPNWTEAEEILQDTYVRLCQQVEEWDPGRDFRAWACTVARFEVMTHQRRAQRSRMQLSQAFVEAAADKQQDREEELSLRAEALTECVQKLKPIRRRLLDLAYRGGYSVEQVAEQLNYSIAATYKTLARLRQSLHECIERSIRLRERE